MPTLRSPGRMVGVVLVAAGAVAACCALTASGAALALVAVAAAGGVALGAGVALLGRRVPDARAAPAPDPVAGAVAHRMSSPLSSLKSNLEWLRDALEAGRLREPGRDEAEAKEVLRDAREAAEALRADVGQLRAAARPPGDPKGR